MPAIHIDTVHILRGQLLKRILWREVGEPNFTCQGRRDRLIGQLFGQYEYREVIRPDIEGEYLFISPSPHQDHVFVSDKGIEAMIFGRGVALQ
ncbi:hypothetical protein D3C78_1496900 [compost metagenome]